MERFTQGRWTAAQRTFPGIRCPLASHGLPPFPSALSCLWAFAYLVSTQTAVTLLLSTDWFLLFILKISACAPPQPPGPFSRVRCLQYRLSRQLLPVLCRARSAWAPLCECEPCDEAEPPFPAAGRRSVSAPRVGRNRKSLSAWS